MEPTEAADRIRELNEEKKLATERHEVEGRERFRTRSAVGIAVLAAFLALASLGRENAAEQRTNSNIQASDTFAFYQAKNIRQTDYLLAQQQLEATVSTLPAPEQAAARGRIDEYKAKIAKLESDPTAPKGTGGKKELLDQAQGYIEVRDQIERRIPNLEYAQALFQIAIVLGSLAIVANSRPMFSATVVLGGIATLLTINGFFTLIPFPTGG